MKAKKNEKLWSKISDLSRPITKNLDGYDKKYIKIKFNLDDELPLNKTQKFLGRQQLLEFFYENNKYYSQFFFDEYLYKI